MLVIPGPHPSGLNVETTPMRELIKEMPGIVFAIEIWVSHVNNLCDFDFLAGLYSRNCNTEQWLYLLVLQIAFRMSVPPPPQFVLLISM